MRRKFLGLPTTARSHVDPTVVTSPEQAGRGKHRPPNSERLERCTRPDRNRAGGNARQSVSTARSNSLRPRALPAFAPLLHQAGKDFGLAGVGGDVGIFLGVGHGVVEFDGVDDGRIVAMDPDGQAVMVGAHGVAHELKRLPVAIYPARILAEGRPLPGAARLLEHGPEAVAFEVRRQWQAREVTKRRVNVDEFRQRAGVGSG